MSLDVYLEDNEGNELYWANITHNLGGMATEAGIYECLWHPEEKFKTARDIAPALLEGVVKMLTDPKKYEAMNSPNGWGLYENFLPWCIRYLRACQDNPNALVRVSR